MEILQFLGGQGLFLILALLIVGVVVYNKIKNRK